MPPYKISFNVQKFSLISCSFVCFGKGTRQVVILKTKIKPVSINAAANCNEHILWSDDVMLIYTVCSMFMTELPYQFVNRWFAAKRFLIFLVITIPIYFFCECHEQNLVWNWYGSMEDCLPFHSWNLPFHSILAYSIPKFPFHSIFHSIPCPDTDYSRSGKRVRKVARILAEDEKIWKRMAVCHVKNYEWRFQIFTNWRVSGFSAWKRLGECSICADILKWSL